jgi:D-alanine transaminase
MHDRGVVTEGGSSNLWIVRDGVAQTRPLSSDILAGITRHALLDVADARNIPVRQRAFTLQQALGASEMFMTSATSFVLPITRIDDAVIGSGAPGPVTMALREGYIERARSLTQA